MLNAQKCYISQLSYMSVAPPTFDEHLIFCAFHVQVDAAAALRVVDATQLRYVLEASFVYVHITCCNTETRRHEVMALGHHLKGYSSQ